VTLRPVQQEIHALEEQRRHALLLADSGTLNICSATGSSIPKYGGRSEGKSNCLKSAKREVCLPQDRAPG
jgi:hypothetical protein